MTYFRFAKFQNDRLTAFLDENVSFKLVFQSKSDLHETFHTSYSRYVEVIGIHFANIKFKNMRQSF